MREIYITCADDNFQSTHVEKKWTPALSLCYINIITDKNVDTNCVSKLKLINNEMNNIFNYINSFIINVHIREILLHPIVKYYDPFFSYLLKYLIPSC